MHLSRLRTPDNAVATVEVGICGREVSAVATEAEKLARYSEFGGIQ